MGRSVSPFLGPREERGVFTLIAPRAVLDVLRRISERTQVSRHALTALALDEYARRHYPEVALGKDERERVLAEQPLQEEGHE